MKKLFLLLILLSTYLVNAQTNWSKTDANYVIGYQNSVTDYLNTNSGNVKYFNEGFLEGAQKKYAQNKLNTYLQGGLFLYNNKSHSFDKTIFSPPSQFNQTDKNFYAQSTNKLDSVLQAMATISSTFHAYEKAKTFETDKGENGKQYTATLLHLTDRFYTLRKGIFNKFDELEDYLFEISIQGSPKAKYLIPMNKCLQKARSMSQLLYDVENYEANKTQIETISSELVRNFEEFDAKRDYYKTQLAHEYSDFERFYIRLNKYCENAKEFTAKVEENPYLLDENDYESIGRHYNYVVDNYNYFIN